LISICWSHLKIYQGSGFFEPQCSNTCCNTVLSAIAYHWNNEAGHQNDNFLVVGAEVAKHRITTLYKCIINVSSILHWKIGHFFRIIFIELFFHLNFCLAGALKLYVAITIRLLKNIWFSSSSSILWMTFCFIFCVVLYVILFLLL